MAARKSRARVPDDSTELPPIPGEIPEEDEESQEVMPDEDGPYRELPPYLQGNHIPRRGVDTFLDGSFGGAHGGHGGISHDDLQHDGFSPSMGQVTTPPMWKDASRSPRTVQLRVCHVRDGIDYHVGAIHARASVRELARKFRRPGVYRLTPVDMTGNSTGSTFPIAIAEDHEVLREEAASANGQGGGVPVGHGTGLGQLDPAVLAFFSQQVETARSEAERERRALQQERQQLQTEHRQISKERMSLAVTNTSAAVDLHTKLIDKDQERNSSAQDRLLMFMQAQQDLQAQRSEAMMLQLQQQSALVQKQMETSVQSEQLRLDAERTRIQEERKREREDQRRREDESKRANEREAERQREHTRLVVSLLEKQNTPVDPMATVTGMLEKAEPLMDMAKKYLPMLQLGGAAGGGITETIASTIGQVVQGQVEVAKAQAEAMAQTAALHQQQIAEIPPEEYEAMMMAQQQAQAGAAHPGQQLQPHQAAPFQAPSQSVMDRPGGSPMGGPTPDASAAFAPSFYPQGEEPPPFQSYDPTPAPSPYRAAPPDSAAEMAPAQAKAARRAVRILVQQLRTLPQGDWIEAVTGAITHDPVVVPFLRLVGIRGAIMECGGDMNLADAVIHTLDAVGDLVPADIPR